MNREQLLEEVWREYIKDEILACVIIRESKPLNEACKECEFYRICTKILEGEKEGE